VEEEEEGLELAKELNIRPIRMHRQAKAMQ
jgi:hypothetical protein